MQKKLINIFIVQSKLKNGSKKKFVFSFTLRHNGMVDLFAGLFRRSLCRVY